MGTYKIEQIKDIILNNPNKAWVEDARKKRKQRMLLVHGIGLDKALKRKDFLENEDIYNARKEDAVSVVDLFSRILNEEDQVFTTRGGNVNFKLSDEQERQMNAIVDNVQHEMSLHNWVRTIAKKARDVDPEGIVLMEAEEMTVVDEGENNAPRCYPTYKSTEEIHDLEVEGRKLEYVCFQLFAEQLADFGITDEQYKNKDCKERTAYYRFIDDEKDVVLKQENGKLIIITSPIISQKNPIANLWGEVPGFILSDLVRFDEPDCFYSPIDDIVELGMKYLDDRSIKDLQMKYHGFAKAVEPLLKCNTCKGTGSLEGNGCPDCTPAGLKTGIGYKLRTKVSDVAKFPLDIMEKVSSFNFKNIYGYVTPDVESYNLQVSNLKELESMMYCTHYNINSAQVQGFNGKDSQQKDMGETATKTLMNLQPKYAVLNKLADWGEKTEKMIADYMGIFWFEGNWKGAVINYGRNYILETPQDLAAAYYDMLKNNAPDTMKDEALERYISALYQNSPGQQIKYLKLMKVIPFPHETPNSIEASQFVSFDDKLAKRYGGEWEDTVGDMYIINTSVEDMRKALYEYVGKKGIKEPAPAIPALN